MNGIDLDKYCEVTPLGVFRIDEHHGHSKYQLWRRQNQANKYNTHLLYMDNDVNEYQMTENALNKIYYDANDNSLHVSQFGINCKFRLFDAAIHEKYPFIESIIELCYPINDCVNWKINDDTFLCLNTSQSREGYFENLSKWKGYIRVVANITGLFDKFQCALRDEILKKEGQTDGNNEKWDPRKYFTNMKDMPYLKWNRNDNTIEYETYILVNNYHIKKYQSKFNFFEYIHNESMYNAIVPHVFSYLRRRNIATVCRSWNELKYFTHGH